MADEQIGSLFIALKLLGLQETTRGAQELQQVLNATGMTAKQMADNLNKVDQAADQLAAGNKILLQLFRDGEMTTSKYATASERLAMQLEAVNQQMRVGAIGATTYRRAVDDLQSRLDAISQREALDAKSQMAMARGTASPIGGGRAKEEFYRQQEEAERQARASDAFRRRMNADEASAVAQGRADRLADRDRILARDAIAEGRASPIGGGTREHREYTHRQEQFERRLNDAMRERARQQERNNTLAMQAKNLILQMETAQEAHNRRTEQYNAMRARGLITEKQHAEAVKQSEIAMRAHAPAGGKGGGQMAFQAAYGIQDFATVLAMGGGPGRAIMSAQNNLSQMLMVSSAINPVLAATLGTVSAIAAIGIGVWWENYSTGAKNAKDKTKELDEAIKEVSRSASRMREDLQSAFRVQDIGRQGSSASRSSIEHLRRGMDLATTDEHEARSRQAAVAASLAHEVRIRVGSGMDAESIVQSRLQGAGATGRTVPFSQSEIAGIRVEAARQAEASRAKAEEDFKREMAAAIKGSKEYTEAQDSLKKSIDERGRLSRELIVAERQLKFAEEAEVGKRMTLRAMASQSSIESAIKASVRQLAIATGTGSSAQFGMEDALTEFIDGLSKAKGIGATEKRALLDQFGMNQAGMIDRNIADLKKQDARRPEASFQSFSGFGQSLQLSLLKQPDEAKEQRKQQIKLAEQQKAALDGILQQAKAGFVGVAAP